MYETIANESKLYLITLNFNNVFGGQNKWMSKL